VTAALDPAALAQAKRNAVVRLHGDVVKVTAFQLDELRALAAGSPLQRARYCLHASDDAAIHEMIIALTQHCYIRPHRHLNKPESFSILDGALDVLLFDDAGRETERIEMGLVAAGKVAFYRLGTSRWHAVIPRSDTVVYCETTPGPFDPTGTAYPAWAPAEDDAADVAAFLERFPALT